MTAPRQVLPGTTYLLSRRCSERRFFLRPSRIINQIFAYCLAYAAEQTGVVCHAFLVMSNHYHAVISDPEARLPEFSAHLNKLVGKCVNAHLGRWESLWSPEKCSAVPLEEADDVMEKILYCLANPVEAALVESSKQWPGLKSGPFDYKDGPKTIGRPEVFFRADGDMPESLRSEVTVPPAFADLTPAQFSAKLAKALAVREKEHLARHAAEGRKILGREAVLAQDPFDCPEGYEPRRGLNPRVAGRDKWRRIEAIRRLKSFLQAYREAWEQFRAGVKDVVFPAGTYWMCKHAGLQSASPG